MELSVNDLIGLFKLASLGKVTGGLIHNINGPLQNIGLDLEMSQYMLKKETGDNSWIESNIMTRLKRIEEELDRLNTMIKTSSNRVMHADNGFQNFNENLEQELSFLNSNLYYKHNVETTLKLDKHPPLVSNLPENAVLAFSWLLQIVVEEVEELKKNSLYIRTEIKNGLLKIFVNAEISGLPDSINDIYKSTDLDSDNLTAPNNQSDLMLILKIFHSEGILVKINEVPEAMISICVPIRE